MSPFTSCRDCLRVVSSPCPVSSCICNSTISSLLHKTKKKNNIYIPNMIYNLSISSQFIKNMEMERITGKYLKGRNFDGSTNPPI